jgi:hypothetical protein
LEIIVEPDKPANEIVLKIILPSHCHPIRLSFAEVFVLKKALYDAVLECYSDDLHPPQSLDVIHP